MQTWVYTHSGKLQIRSSTFYICLHNQPSVESTDAFKCLHTQQTALSMFSTFNISTLTRPLDESTCRLLARDGRLASSTADSYFNLSTFIVNCSLHHSRHFFYTSVHTFFNSKYTVFNFRADLPSLHYSTQFLYFRIVFQKKTLTSLHCSPPPAVP